MTDNMNSNVTVVLPTAQLRTLCDHAEALGLPEGPNAKFWRDVDEDGCHVVSFNYPGTGVAEYGDGKRLVRAMVACKMHGRSQPQGLLCDFDHEAFTTLVSHSRNRKKVPAR